MTPSQVTTTVPMQVGSVVFHVGTPVDAVLRAAANHHTHMQAFTTLREGGFVRLVNSRRSSGYTVTPVETGDPGVYQELGLEIRNEAGELVAWGVVGLDAGTLEPVVSFTTGADPDDEPGVRVFPTRDHENAVEVT